MNRLDSASGEFTGYNGKKAKYTLSMAYDNMHNIIRKKQDMVQSGLKFTGMLHAGEELNYTINAENCQQIRNIAQSSYRQASPATAAYQTGIPGGVELKHKTEEYGYDANGNLLYVNRGVQTSDSTMQVNHTRKMLWDEENRLQALSDNGFVSNYYYDASGERTVKLSGASQGVFVNGALNNATTNTGKFTAYINPNLVLNSGGYYSKHIYAGTQRIVSKLGSSEIFHSAPTFSALPTGKLTGLTATVKSRYDSLGAAYHGSPQGTNGFETTASGKITTPQLYFYHPDHLGSSSLITDNNGLLVQHLQYLPFGEVFIDERKGSWHTPFTFSAKEQDEETGLHFFGARYYDSRTSTWLSVDPLAEKYPNISSYVYCANNPVKYLDPDGRYIKLASEDVNGKKIITVTVTGKLINESGKAYTTEQMQAYTDRLVSSISSAYTGSDGDVRWKGVAIITLVSDDNPLGANDHAFRIVNQGKIPGAEGEDGVIGKAPFGENVVYLSNHMLDRTQATEGTYSGTGKTDTGTGILERTGPHELGHSGNLKHPTPGTMDGNLMHQTKHSNAGMKLTKDQILQMQKDYDAGKLNQGKQKVE